MGISAFGPSAEVVSLNYEVLCDGRPVGVFKVNKTEIDGTSNFRVETIMAAGLIRRDEFRSVMLSSYEDSKLIMSDLKSWVNNELESSSVIHWDGNQYVKQDGEQLMEICADMVTYSSACVYFQEPLNRTTLFYEKYGQELDVTPLSDSVYEVVLPNGAKERYTYHNGEVSMVEFVQSFATITLRAAS